jgi:hypothetical protein
MTYLTIKDGEGNLRPIAGVWADDKYGRADAEAFLKRSGFEDDQIVVVEIIEKGV